MASLIAVALVTAAFGFAVWGADRRRSSYGMLVPAGTAVSVGLVLWVVLVAVGLGYAPGVHWLSWLLPMLAGCGAAAAVSVALGRRRTARDSRRFSATLQGR